MGASVGVPLWLFVIMALLAAERVALSYAVGEWARIWGCRR